MHHWDGVLPITRGCIWWPVTHSSRWPRCELGAGGGVHRKELHRTGAIFSEMENEPAEVIQEE